MIRKDREVVDFQQILSIVDECDVCRLALNGDDGYPYIVPLNFGYEVVDDQIILYFHSALRGKKHDLIALDNRATAEMDCSHQLLSAKERGYCTMNYQSVIVSGHIDYIFDEAEKFRALTLMTDRYHGGNHFEFNSDAMARTSVYKLVVSSITGKRKATKI